jgi:hypothetical protein
MTYYLTPFNQVKLFIIASSPFSVCFSFTAEASKIRDIKIRWTFATTATHATNCEDINLLISTAKAMSEQFAYYIVLCLGKTFIKIIYVYLYLLLFILQLFY